MEEVSSARDGLLIVGTSSSLQSIDRYLLLKRREEMQFKHTYIFLSYSHSKHYELTVRRDIEDQVEGE